MSSGNEQDNPANNEVKVRGQAPVKSKKTKGNKIYHNNIEAN